MSVFPTMNFKVALCSMPWAIFNRPSIQLASLKSYLQQKSDYKVDTFHTYLDIAALLGIDIYPEIALSGWAGEALFSALLYPEKATDAAKLFSDNISAATRKKIDFDSLTLQIEKLCDNWLNSIDFASYNLVGFSICFSQLLPSLYMAELIKKKHPELPIVFGGSSCCGEVGQSLLRQFQQLDYIIDGEGEERLLNLCKILEGENTELADGVLSRNTLKQSTTQIAPLDLTTLPLPDYISYFNEIKKTFPAHPFIPLLPIEFSRGCWWNKCTFCNLNIQWPNYRFKSGDKMIAEVMALSQKYESLHFTFTDNALPPREADHFFSEIATKGIDFDFFAEIRGTRKVKRLQQYRSGGLTTIQVGIEALSTSLLDKMDKGNSTMDNIAMMKLCAEENITLEGNLIVDFPSTTTGEIHETITNLAYVLPYAPLESASFFLGYGSPIYNNLKEFSIQSILPHSKTKLLFPKHCHETMTMLISSYRGDRTVQQKNWAPVREVIDAWHTFHKNRKNRDIPALSYRDGENFLIIRQELAGGVTLHHRLRGISRKIYLSAPIPTSIDDIGKMFPKVKTKALTAFIEDMCSKRLMFQENGQAISLAIHQ